MDCLSETHGPVPQTIAQRFAMKQLGDDVRRVVVLADMEDRNDIGVVQRGSSLGFKLKPTQALQIVRPVGRKHLDSYITFQRSIMGSIHLSHSTRAEKRDDFKGIQPSARGYWHTSRGLYPDLYRYYGSHLT